MLELEHGPPEPPPPATSGRQQGGLPAGISALDRRPGSDSTGDPCGSTSPRHRDHGPEFPVRPREPGALSQSWCSSSGSGTAGTPTC